MPSKSLGLFPASLSTDPLFCLEFVEITNKIETTKDLKARERKGVAASGPLSPSARALAGVGGGASILPTISRITPSRRPV